MPGEQKDKTLERICREGCTQTEPAASLIWEFQCWSKEKEHVLNHSRNPNQQIFEPCKTMQLIPPQHKIHLFKAKHYREIPQFGFSSNDCMIYSMLGFFSPLSLHWHHLVTCRSCNSRHSELRESNGAASKAASSASASAKPTTSSNHKIFSVSSCSQTFHKDLSGQQKNNQTHDLSTAVPQHGRR